MGPLKTKLAQTHAQGVLPPVFLYSTDWNMLKQRDYNYYKALQDRLLKSESTFMLFLSL